MGSKIKKKSKELECDKSLEKLQKRVVNILRPLLEVYTMKNSDSSEYDFHSLTEALEQTIVLVGQAVHSVTYCSRKDIPRR